MVEEDYCTIVFFNVFDSFCRKTQIMVICNRAPNKGKSGSTLELHRDFWTWRDAYPGEPYWVHFQTTDVHDPHRPLAPFAGLFAPRGEAQLARWDSTVTQWWQSSSPEMALAVDIPTFECRARTSR